MNSSVFDSPRLISSSAFRCARRYWSKRKFLIDQVALPRARGARVGHELPHAVELLVAREDQEALAGLATPLVLLLDLVDELAHQVEHAVARPGLVPEVAGCVAALGW